MLIHIHNSRKAASRGAPWESQSARRPLSPTLPARRRTADSSSRRAQRRRPHPPLPRAAPPMKGVAADQSAAAAH